MRYDEPRLVRTQARLTKTHFVTLSRCTSARWIVKVGSHLRRVSPGPVSISVFCIL
jgi:hypothetical protein